MGKKLFTRADAWEDPNWIVELTKNTIGASSLAKVLGDSPLRVYFWEHIMTRVRGMSGQTLGRINAYGGHIGFHTGGIPHAATFLNMTGYHEIQVRPATEWLEGHDGRAMMEILAATTILCIARDIIMQDQWQVRIADELEDKGYMTAVPRGQRGGPIQI